MKHVWRILWYTFQLAVVLYVFEHLKEPSETITVAILGLLYAAMEIEGISKTGTNLAFARDVAYLRAMVDKLADPTTVDVRERVSAAAQISEKVQTKAAFDAGYLAILSLLCLWKLFSTL